MPTLEKTYAGLMDTARQLQKSIKQVNALGLPGADELRRAQGIVLAVAWTVRPTRKRS